MLAWIWAGLLAAGWASFASASPAVPYVPTPSTIVEAMLDLANTTSKDHVVDLGSGDGRIAIAAGERGASAHGYEIDSDLVGRANGYARGAGLSGRVRFTRRDMFEAPIRAASVVTLYLLPEVNLKLRPKLLTELKPGTRIVSHAFDMGDWRADAQRVVERKTLHLWIVPAVAGGRWRMTMADGRRVLLELDQRFQEVSGTFDGQTIGNASLSGTALRFSAGGKTYYGVVSDAAITADPAAPASAVAGWNARRAD